MKSIRGSADLADADFANRSLARAGYDIDSSGHSRALSSEMARESARGRAMSGGVTVSPTMNVTNQVTVLVDGNSVAAAIWPHSSKRSWASCRLYYRPGATDAHSSYQSPGAVGHAGL